MRDTLAIVPLYVPLALVVAFPVAACDGDDARASRQAAGPAATPATVTSDAFAPALGVDLGRPAAVPAGSHLVFQVRLIRVQDE